VYGMIRHWIRYVQNRWQSVTKPAASCHHGQCRITLLITAVINELSGAVEACWVNTEVRSLSCIIDSKIPWYPKLLLKYLGIPNYYFKGKMH
jgi:hypothetical protein